MANNNELELRDYIEVLLRQKWIIVLVFLVTAISAGVGALYLVKPVYQASALLMISKPGYQVELEPKIKTSIPLEISIETYKNLIRSADLERKVIKKLGLDQPPDELTIEALNNMVSVEAVSKTDLIRISIKSGVPGKAKKIVDTWLALFIEENKDLGLRETKEAQSFIENQLEISEQNLFAAEEELCKFNEKSKIDSLKKEIEEKLTKMISYELKLGDVRISLKKEEAKLNQIKVQMAAQEKILTSADISQLTAGMKYSEAKNFIEEQLRLSKKNLDTKEEELKRFNEKSKIDSLKKEIEEKLTKMISYELKLGDVRISLKKEEAKLNQIKVQMAAQEKILTSEDISQLTAGMKYSEAKNFIEEQLRLSKKNLDTKEEELKRFNEKSRISILEKEIADKIGRIISSEGRLTDLKVLVKGKEAELNQAENQLAKQPETFVLTKSMYDDASFNQLTSELTPKEALLLKNLRFESEELNPLYTALRSRVANLKIDLDRYQSEAIQLTENITTLRKELEEARKEYAAEELELTNLEREVQVLRNTYRTLATKGEETKIATATPALQEKATSPTNPEYLKLQTELISGQISQEELLAEKNELAINITTLRKELEEAKKEYAAEELELTNLEREVEVLRNTYRTLATKGEEARIATATPALQEKATSLTNPEYLRLQAELISGQISQEELLAEKNELAENVNSYRTRIELIKKELAAQELTRSRLERIKNTANSVYDVVFQKAAETKIVVATEIEVVKIVSLAHEPENPVGSGKRRIVLIGGVLGLFMGIFIAFFVDYWKRTEKRKEPTPKVKGNQK